MTNFCNGCGHALTTKGDCLPCGAFKVRLSRALKILKDNGEPNIALDYNKLTDEEKIKFRKENHKKLGKDLKMAIQRRFKQTSRSEVLQRALQKGHMKDATDLKEKYANKPGQLKAIFKNGITFECPIRECTLWADPDFVTEWQFTESDETEEVVSFETNSTESTAKKQKTEKAPPMRATRHR